MGNQINFQIVHHIKSLMVRKILFNHRQKDFGILYSHFILLESIRMQQQTKKHRVRQQMSWTTSLWPRIPKARRWKMKIGEIGMFFKDDFIVRSRLPLCAHIINVYFFFGNMWEICTHIMWHLNYVLIGYGDVVVHPLHYTFDPIVHLNNGWLGLNLSRPCRDRQSNRLHYMV